MQAAPDLDLHQPLPPQAISLQWLQEKYAWPGELVPDETRRRVAQALASVEPVAQRRVWFERFFWALRAGLLPGGRIMAGAHPERPREASLMNCFVLPAQPLAALRSELRRTLSAGGGVGLDLSAVQGSVLEVLDECEAVARSLMSTPAPSGLPRPVRRAAQMAVLDFHHGQIDDFIQAKADPSADGHPHFTFTVSIDDATMRELASRAPGASLQRWQALARAVWRSGEPGLVFIDAVHRDDNLGLSERLSATNPCGEQPLPAHGACALASIDLTRVVQSPLEPGAHLSWGQLNALAQIGVRLLDNALDLSAWPLPEQARRQQAQRRIGLGLTGLADALMLLGLRYGSAPALRMTASIGRFLSHAAYRASVRLARERGPCAAFHADAVLSLHHRAHRLPAPLQQAIRRHGLRNTHLLAIAPAASISMVFADAVSPGVEPAPGWWHRRRWLDPQGRPFEAVVMNPVWRRWVRQHGLTPPLPPFMVTAAGISPEQQLATVAALAPSIDAGISKTLSLPRETTVAEVQDLLVAAWAAGLKGITAFRTDSRPSVIGIPGEDLSP